MVMGGIRFVLLDTQKRLDRVDRFHEVRVFDPAADVGLTMHHRLHPFDERDVFRRPRHRVERGLTDIDASLDRERHPRLNGARAVPDVVSPRPRRQTAPPPRSRRSGRAPSKAVAD
jgi:hypothetical protein